MVGYVDRDKVISTIYKKTNGVEESTDHNIRILKAKKVTGVISWKIYSTTNTELLTTTDFPYAGHLDDPDIAGLDLNFGVAKELYFDLVTGGLQNNLFNIFYSGYFGEIIDKDSRLVTCKMKFKPSDIFNLDFGRLIFLDGVVYRLVKIKDYSDNEICEVELLRVIYTQFESPYYRQYNLGDALNGGYIVHIDGSGRHGLIAPDYDDVEQLFAYNWLVAINYCNNFSSGGYDDWRMGTLNEYLLIDLNTSYIPNFSVVSIWTITEYNTLNAYQMTLDGSGINYSPDEKIQDYFTLPIKSF